MDLEEFMKYKRIIPVIIYNEEICIKNYLNSHLNK